MKKRYLFGLGFAHSIWCRPDLEPKPANMERVAEVLQQAGIEVYEVRHNWLACEPCPAGIWDSIDRQAGPTRVGKTVQFSARTARARTEISGRQRNTNF